MSKPKNPKRECRMCGRRVHSNVRFCVDCAWKRKREREESAGLDACAK